MYRNQNLYLLVNHIIIHTISNESLYFSSNILD